MCWMCRASPGLGLDAPARSFRLLADAPQDTAPRFHLTPGGHAGAGWAAERLRLVRR
jgi:hypothetical protein